MRPFLKRLSVLATASMLLACAESGYRAVSPNAFDSADEAYMAGRNQHMAGRFDQAIEAYQTALKIMPTHINARNGLATVHAEQGNLQIALPLWQALAASVNEGRDTAFLFSNLGYAHFLTGDTEQAIAVLEKACLLDPLNHRAWAHLGDALHKVGQHKRAKQMYRQASALQGHDIKADYAVAGRAKVPAIAQAVQANDDGFATTQLTETSTGLFELRRIGKGGAPIPATLPALALTSGGLLEIRNGNGVPGMARSVASTLSDSGMTVVRLSNQKGYGVARTRIEYQPESRDAALRLALRFADAKVTPVNTVGRADVRLVIGRDLIGGVELARPPALARKEAPSKKPS